MASRRKRGPPSDIEADWGKTKPFWCLTCGYGCTTPRKVREHMERTGHKSPVPSGTQLGAGKVSQGEPPIGTQGLSENQKEWAWRHQHR